MMSTISAPYNALLLQKVLCDNDVSEDVVSAVFGDIEAVQESFNIEKETLSSIFSDHEIDDLLDVAYKALENDGPALPYGSIACP